MNIGESVLAKINGKIIKCFVVSLGEEDVVLNDGINKEEIRKKYWEIRTTKGTIYEDKD